MNETYQNYVNRVARLTLPATYDTQLGNIQPSPKFQGGEAVSFPGYSIISPPGREDEGNKDFYNNLQTYQEQLLEHLDSGLFLPVPSDSFHVTVADLIWDNRYREAIRENPEFEIQLKKLIAESFGHYRHFLTQGDAVRWQLLGLTIRPRALVVGLVPKDEESYERVLKLRTYIYQNADLIKLGIEQQYPFTAHVTLGYFGKIPSEAERDRISHTLSELNDRWVETEPQVLTIHRVQLRKFDDMMNYYREPDWPELEL